MKSKSGESQQPSEEFKKFEQLAKRLVRVPKKDIKEAERKAKLPHPQIAAQKS